MSAKRIIRFSLSGLIVMWLVFGLAVFASAVLADSGTVNVQVTDKTHSVVDEQTLGGAFVSYFGDSDTTFGSSGTGIFDPFVRLQGSPTEQGYNTNGVTEFDTKTGKWTHAILVSHIPQRPCPQVSPTQTCFELWNDINENNSKSANASHISLNKVEIYYTDDPNLTGYNSFSSTITPEYKFEGDILINDVNQGSGRGDLRYDIPIGTGVNQMEVPENCDYGNPACTTYFVLYSEWGMSSGSFNYNSDGGFEEWKVKQYPAISLTKTPDVTDICNGSDTSVTYTYVVTNNSFGKVAVSGIVEDNIYGTIGSFSDLASGASITLTKTASVSGTVTNIATASVTDADGNTATATAEATVTGHVCSISVTKVPDQTDVCNGTSVGYTIVVTNNSPEFDWTGDVEDDVLGTLATSVTIPAGGHVTYTPSHIISGTVHNTVTATGNFNDPASSSASSDADATVIGRVCSISQITPTETTCNDFANGTAATLSMLQYTVKDDLINSVSPGVFFYWVGFTASPGNNTFTIRQVITTGNFDSHYFTFAAGSNAFDTDCNSLGASISQSGADVTVTFNVVSGGQVYLGIKFSSSSVKNFAPPTGDGTAHYTFETVGLASSTEGLDLSEKNP
jgi:hypothetical protein